MIISDDYGTAITVEKVVPVGDGNCHNLYLEDGRVVKINASTGRVLRVFRLPSVKEIEQAEAKLSGRSGADDDDN